MSALPPENPPTTPPQPPLPPAYAWPQSAEARNGMAIAALVCGILGLFMCPPAALLGIIFGIIGIVRSASLPTGRGRGPAIAGLVCGACGVLYIPLLLAILLPSLSRAREIAKRAVCASNLRGVGQGMKVYSNDHADWYPIAPFLEPERGETNAMSVAFIGALGRSYTDLFTSETDLARVHPSRSLFMLVIDGSCTPKHFICPSSGDVEDDLRNLKAGVQVAAQPGINRFDFKGYPHLSYGYQLPFGPRGRPNENLDPRMVIMADKGPFFDAGAAGPAGEVPDRYVAGHTPGAAISLASVNRDATALLQAGNDAWRPLNSRNHRQEGENALFQDGHVEFTKRPISGVNFDNIYTVQASRTLEDSLLGNSPQDRLGPLTETDSVIVP